MMGGSFFLAEPLGLGNFMKQKTVYGLNHATFNRQPSAFVTLLIVIKPGLPFSERDLYRLARVHRKIHIYFIHLLIGYTLEELY